MKTKFTQLVLLRKKKVDEAELMLQKNARHIIAKQGEIDALVQEFATLKEPQNGIYQAFLTFVHHKEEYRSSIDFKMQELAELKQEKKALQEHFKLQNVEYEKAKYLDGLEVKKMLDKARIQENRNLDEISVMLHANNKDKH
ncbi:flagellar export protein FliJ [Helicobacter turcicus]|uniref:Flagellar export protein FliJ n=1 Tax=Helicobacter turcicus TaxID=2867412 RepID=A0ABS7JP53_9HELI|nr:flagellar export protein FliJ [Helicobacter turcicus]MBX7491145.1 flagellar export protein FliJ [Helicobacter turcicus]MBX7546012.1 flagellar export protein FliJ [Helicobacter turcicus]